MTHVLYVDDDEILLDLTQAYLQTITDFVVTTANSASLALKMLKEDHFDAVVSDYEMPEMNGIEFLKTLRAGGSDIPFIIFTGRGREEVVIEALNEGADHYLQKGGEPEPVYAELVHKINRAVGKRRDKSEILSNAMRLHSTFDSITDMMAIVDRDFVLQEVNRVIFENYGKKREDIIGKNCYRVFHDLDTVCSGCVVQKAFAEQKVVREVKTVDHGSGKITLETTCTPINCDGNISEVVVVARDISRKQKQEKRICHLNSVLRAIRNVNQLIVQEKDCEALLNKSCEILTEARGYFRAWIVRIDEEGRFLSAYESGGSELSAPEEFFLNEKGMAVCEQALLAEGGVLVHEDPMASGPLSSVHEGCGAITVRLECSGTVYGLLSVSVPAEYTEDREEHDLLKEVAGDIAYALYNADLEKKRLAAEEETQKAHEFADSILENVPEVIYSQGSDHSFSYISRNCLELTGYSAEEMKADLHLWDDLVFPDDDGIVADIYECVAVGKPFSSEYRIVRKDGVIRWVYDRGVPRTDDTGKFLRLDGSILDVSDRMEALQKIADSEQLYHSTVDNLHEEVHVVTPDLTIELFNRTGIRWCEDFGISMGGDVVGRNFLDVFPFINSRVIDEYRRVIETKKPLVTEEQNMIRGIPVYTESRKIPLIQNGEVYRILTIVRDITKEKRNQDALSEINKKLNLLFSVTRHDLLNQVTGLKMYVKIINNAISAGNSALAEEYFYKMKHSLNSAENIISFTREYQDLGVHAPSWQNVGQIVQSTSALLDYDGISVISDLDDLEIFADPMLNKVFINLFTNVRMHAGDVTTVRISFHEQKGAGIIVVEDDGRGVPADIKGRIFEKGVGGNTGFGLFLVEVILALTRITITETGRAGEGARFEIKVPMGRWRFADTS